MGANPPTCALWESVSFFRVSKSSQNRNLFDVVLVNTFSFIIFATLVGFVLFQQLRLRAIRRVLDEVASAAELGYFPLFAIPERILVRFHIRRINRSIEHLRNDHNQLEQRYLACEQSATEVIDAIQEALVVVGGDNCILRCNPAASEKLAISPGPNRRIEMQLRSVAFLELIHRVRRGDRIHRDRIEIQTDRGLGTYEVSAFTAGTPKGSQILFIFNDITRLQVLETVRRDFVADVSHELRTPLTILRGFAQALDDDYHQLDEDKRQRFFQKIHRNIERLSALVEDLLSLSRLEAGHTALNLTRVDIKSLVTTILEDYREHHGSKYDPFESVLPEPEVILHADPMQIGQILRNLLDNAVRYAETHTYIRVRVDQLNDPDEVLIEVEDDGVGVPRQDTERIFQRFYRVDKGRSREKGGTGLGLSIVKHAVQLHGGRVEASSFPGRGLRVTCRFPRTHPRLLEATPQATPAVPANPLKT